MTDDRDGNDQAAPSAPTAGRALPPPFDQDRTATGPQPTANLRPADVSPSPVPTSRPPVTGPPVRPPPVTPPPVTPPLAHAPPVQLRPRRSRLPAPIEPAPLGPPAAPVRPRPGPVGAGLSATERNRTAPRPRFRGPRLIDPIGFWRRLRSVIELIVTTVVLGLLLAAVLGGAIGVIVIALQHALNSSS